MDSGFILILDVALTACVFAWNVVQAWTFLQDKFRPPEEKEQFDAQKALMIQRIHEMLLDQQEGHDYQEETDSLVRQIADLQRQIHAILDKTDQDGVRLCYIPRSMARDIRHLLRKDPPSDSSLDGT